MFARLERTALGSFGGGEIAQLIFGAARYVQCEVQADVLFAILPVAARFRGLQRFHGIPGAALRGRQIIALERGRGAADRLQIVDDDLRDAARWLGFSKFSAYGRPDAIVACAPPASPSCAW